MGEYGQIITIAVAGAVGAFLIGRLTSGKRGKRVFAAWLALPFLVSFLFFAYMDARGSGEPWLIWLPIVWMMIAVPWIPVSFIAVLIGRWLRRRAVPKAPSHPAEIPDRSSI